MVTVSRQPTLNTPIKTHDGYTDIHISIVICSLKSQTVSWQTIQIAANAIRYSNGSYRYDSNKAKLHH